MKKIFLILIFSIAVFANNYSLLENRKADVSKYKALLNKKADVSKFSNLKFKQNPDFVKDFSNNSFTGSNFMDAREFQATMKKVEKIKKRLNRERDFILYFISETMPKEIIYRILFQVGILQDNGIDIESRQYFNGFGKKFQDYLMSAQKEINEKPKFERIKIIRNAQFKVDPTFYRYFRLKRVPAIVLAKCKGQEPDFKTCSFKFLLRGDTSLESFFDKIAVKDKKYEKYYKVLQANKFDKEVKNNEN